MGNTVTVSFTKTDGTSGDLTFKNVDDVNTAGMDGGGYMVIAYRENDTNGTIDHVEDHDTSWE